MINYRTHVSMKEIHSKPHQCKTYNELEFLLLVRSSENKPETAWAQATGIHDTLLMMATRSVVREKL